MSDDPQAINDDDEADRQAARKIMTVTVAALLFANSDSWTGANMQTAFDKAEAFVAEAERRYGRIIPPP